VQLVDTGFPLDDPALLQQGAPPLGGAVGQTVYYISFTGLPHIERVDANGTQGIDVGEQPNYALAVWPGNESEPPRLAFGTSPSGDNPRTQLFIASVDGSTVTRAHSETPAAGSPPYQLVPQRWTEDGESLYFSREPYGIGGYIPFNGASSLLRYDVAARGISQLIPFDPALNFLCLGDINASQLRAAGNCLDRGAITVHDLISPSADTTTITPPAGLGEARLLGSARLSPDVQRVAFALARGDPENEQGWVAVSDGPSGEARLILTSDPGAYYTVAGWLDTSTLLLQAVGVDCDPPCPLSLWTVGADGSDLTPLTDGQFLSFMAIP
jgi:hypothetical protein